MPTTPNPLFSLAIPPSLPTNEVESLLLTLRTTVDLQETKSRVLGAEWAVFIAIAKDVGTIAGTVAALLKIANEITAWRKNAKQRGVNTDIKLQHPSSSPLELKTATDEEVKEWFSRLK